MDFSIKLHTVPGILVLTRVTQDRFLTPFRKGSLFTGISVLTNCNSYNCSTIIVRTKSGAIGCQFDNEDVLLFETKPQVRMTSAKEH